eukprot:jgi/Bigna1/136088/aug1.32_g10796
MTVQQLVRKYNGEISSLAEEREKEKTRANTADAQSSSLTRQLLDQKVRLEEIAAKAEKEAQAEADSRIKRELGAFQQRNQIMDVGARALLEGLARNDTLIAMPLSGNKDEKDTIADCMSRIGSLTSRTGPGHKTTTDSKLLDDDAYSDE